MNPQDLRILLEFTDLNWRKGHRALESVKKLYSKILHHCERLFEEEAGKSPSNVVFQGTVIVQLNNVNIGLYRYTNPDSIVFLTDVKLDDSYEKRTLSEHSFFGFKDMLYLSNKKSVFNSSGITYDLDSFLAEMSTLPMEFLFCMFRGEIPDEPVSDNCEFEGYIPKNVTLSFNDKCTIQVKGSKAAKCCKNLVNCLKDNIVSIPYTVSDNVLKDIGELINKEKCKEYRSIEFSDMIAFIKVITFLGIYIGDESSSESDSEKSAEENAAESSDDLNHTFPSFSRIEFSGLLDSYRTEMDTMFEKFAISTKCHDLVIELTSDGDLLDKLKEQVRTHGMSILEKNKDSSELFEILKRDNDHISLLSMDKILSFDPENKELAEIIQQIIDLVISMKAKIVTCEDLRKQEDAIKGPEKKAPKVVALDKIESLEVIKINC